MQQVLEPLGDGDRLPEPEGDVAHLGGGDVLVGGELVGDPVGVDLGQERPGRGEQAEGDAGDGGVDAGLEGRQPDAGAEHDVDGQVPDLRPAQGRDREQAGGGRGEPAASRCRRSRRRR